MSHLRTVWRSILLEQGGSFQVGIVVQDLAPMIEFYEGLLGFSHLDDLALPGGVLKRFVLGNARLKLLVLEDVPKYPNAPGGPMGGVAGLRYLTVAVADVADTVEKCQAAGRPVPMPVFDHEPGVPVAIVEDPEGTWVELIQAIET